jgi:type VI secretion system protein ImpK
MTIEQYPISLVHGLSISGASLVPKSYYRSKLFIAAPSTNRLVAAAGPLLSLLERLCMSTSLPPIEEIRNNIAHELYAFLSRLNSFEYPSDLIGIAHYLLSATIDELLGKSYLRVYNIAVEFKSFTPATGDEMQPQQRFFEILHYVKERPNQYLDIIELLYFCLIAGFEGQYHVKADGRQALDNTMEDLYQIIQQYRFHPSARLFHENSLPKAMKKNYKTAIVSTVLVATIILFAFLTSHILLENKAKLVLSGHTQLAMLDN